MSYQLIAKRPFTYFCLIKYFKLLAEKWSWHDETIQNGYFAFSSGDMEKAVVNYLVSAEAGFEISQVNAAWIIDSGRFKSKPDSLIYTEKKNTPWDPYTVALTLWNRAANQGHVDARVKVGDYFYYGRGFSRENDTELEESKTIDTLAQYVSTAFLLPGGNQSGIPDYAEAAKQYANAADIYQSSLAMYNLAYMYESGYGLDQVPLLNLGFLFGKKIL